MTISINTPNALLFNLQKHIRYGTLESYPIPPQYFVYPPLNILRKSINVPFFKCSATEVEASRRSEYF